MSSSDKSKKAASLCNLLGKKLKVEPPREYFDLLEAMLILILMEKMPEDRAEQAVKRLGAAFVDWNEVRVTRSTQVLDSSKESQMDERLAKGVRNALQKLYYDRADFALDFLKSESLPTIREYLLNTLGLAPRPAARLMLLVFGKAVLPLAEEVKRISERVGLINPSWTRDRAQKSLERVVPSQQMYEFYHLTLQHGEATCLPGKPRCSRCVLRRICDYYAGRLPAKTKRGRKSGSKSRPRTITKRKTSKKLKS